MDFTNFSEDDYMYITDDDMQLFGGNGGTLENIDPALWPDYDPNFNANTQEDTTGQGMFNQPSGQLPLSGQPAPSGLPAGQLPLPTQPAQFGQPLGQYPLPIQSTQYSQPVVPTMVPIQPVQSTQYGPPIVPTMGPRQPAMGPPQPAQFGQTQPYPQIPQPSQPPSSQPTRYPSDNYHREVGWYNRAEGTEPNAMWNRYVGWYTRAAGDDRSLLPPSAVASSTVSTPTYRPTPVAGPTPPALDLNQPRPSMGMAVPSAAPPPTRPLGIKKSKLKQPVKKRSHVQVCVCPRKPAPKRPRNPFILFRQAYSKQIKMELGTIDNKKVSLEASRRWHDRSDSVDAEFTKRFKQEKADHAAQNEGYVYQPGAKNAADFGTEDCKCGAYQRNLEYERQKDMARVAATVNARPATRSERQDQEVPVSNDDDISMGYADSNNDEVPTGYDMNTFTQPAPQQTFGYGQPGRITNTPIRRSPRNMSNTQGPTGFGELPRRPNPMAPTNRNQNFPPQQPPMMGQMTSGPAMNTRSNNNFRNSQAGQNNADDPFNLNEIADWNSRTNHNPPQGYNNPPQGYNNPPQGYRRARQSIRFSARSPKTARKRSPRRW